MPIGSSKVGLFGGKPIVPAGSETFNSPGTFVVPEGLEIVTVSGNGSTGNAGNPGGAGTGGFSGAGGSAGTLTNNDPFAPNQNWNYNPGLDVKPGGTGRQAPGGPGLSGNPGNAGATTSALGQTFTNGNSGNGGTAGNPGASGNSGNAGNSSNIARACAGNSCTPTPFGGSGGTSNTSPINTGGTGMKGQATSVDNPPPINIQQVSLNGGHGGSGAGSSNPGQYIVGGCMPGPGTTSASTSPIPGGVPDGGAAGLGVYAFSNASCSYQTPRSPTAGDPGNTTTGFSGGGGGGGGGGRMAANNAGGWAGQTTSGGGGGGSSTSGNPGNPGNPGNSGTPATFNCVATTIGSYPVQVGSGGQITISWNTQ